MSNILQMPKRPILWFPVSPMDLPKKAVLAVMSDKQVITPAEHRSLLWSKIAMLIDQAGHEALIQVENLLPSLRDLSENELPEAILMSDEMMPILGLIEWDQENGQVDVEERIEVADMMKEQTFLSLLEAL